MFNASIQIREFGVVAEGVRLQRDTPDFREVDTTTFSALLRFIEEQSFRPEFEQAFTIFRKGRRRYIRVKSHVGVIETSNGCILEILPKIYNENGGLVVAQCRRIFLRMLKTLYGSSYVVASAAHLEAVEDFPILEFFIQNYLTELELAIRGGLTNDYLIQEDNLDFLRGRLLVNENIRHNFLSRQKFFCSFDSFSPNTALNKILKSTLRVLTLQSRNSLTKRRLLAVSTHFENTDFTGNFRQDLIACKSNQKIVLKFAKLLEWSEIFLAGSSFGNFSGTHSNFSMLFPMEKLFEKYVCFLIKRHCFGLSIKAQDRRFSLVGQMNSEGDTNFSAKLFNLRPDIVIQDNVVVLDTKWKILNENARKYNISEADVYQMHAYGRRYQQSRVDNIPPRLGLIYPMNPNFNHRLLQMRFGDDMLLDVVPINLSSNSPSDEIKWIVKSFLNPSQSEKF